MPSPVVALDIIKRALKKCGAIGEGETPTAEEANDGLYALNDVLERWSIESMAVYGSDIATFALVAGKARYTVGPGGDLNTDRPMSISDAYTTVQGVDFPMEQWTQPEYDAVAVKSQQQGVAERYVYINSAPLGLLIIYPTPAIAVPIAINAPMLLTQVPSLTTTLNLPPGYANALMYAVAQEYGAEFGSPIDVTAPARSALAIVKRANRTPRIAAFDPELVGGGPVVSWRDGV